MCSQFLRWAAVGAMVSILGAFAAAVCASDGRGRG